MKRILFLASAALVAALSFVDAQGVGTFSPNFGTNLASNPNAKTVNSRVSGTPVADRTQSIALVRVEIIDAFIGKLHEIEAVGGKEDKADAEYLQVKVRIYNDQKKGNQPYWSWAYHAFAPAILKDADDKPVKAWSPRQLRPNGAFTYPADGVKVSGMIKPRASVVDIIAFEVPAKLDKDLTLGLPAKNLGGTPDKGLTFKLPAKWFEKK